MGILCITGQPFRQSFQTKITQANQLQSYLTNLRTLYMSGDTPNIVAHHGISKEGIIFLQKPFSKDKLAPKVRQANEQAAQVETPLFIKK